MDQKELPTDVLGTVDTVITGVIVKSAWVSKINWAQALGVLASLGAAYGLNLPPDLQVKIVLSIQGIIGAATWYLKTFHSTTITPSSAAKLDVSPAAAPVTTAGK